jgi:glycine/D-amino acid oxidase-like deaminating enzyme
MVLSNFSSAGVAGLTTALLLSRNTRYKIVVAAKHMPGDYDIEYASPWAGANYMPLVPTRCLGLLVNTE